MRYRDRLEKLLDTAVFGPLTATERHRWAMVRVLGLVAWMAWVLPATLVFGTIWILAEFGGMFVDAAKGRHP